MTEAARYFCGEHQRLLSESKVEKFVCFWCAQNKIAEREAEAATAARDEERKRITRIVENMRENGEPDKQKKRLMISVVEVIAAIGDDKDECAN